MSVVGPDRSSVFARLHKGRRTQTSTRKTLTLGKSLSPILYLISIGLIATWIIGVFFGTGFFFLTPPERQGSHLAVGRTDIGVFSTESPSLLEAMIRLDPLFPEPFAKPAQLAGNKAQTGFADRDRTVSTPGGQSAVEIDRQGTALAAPELEGGALFVDPGELAPVSPPQNRSSASTSLQSGAESPHPASSRKRHQRPPTDTRTPHTHAPVRAIQDVLQKHSRLVKRGQKRV
jgi:hypothetical protein